MSRIDEVRSLSMVIFSFCVEYVEGILACIVTGRIAWQQPDFSISRGTRHDVLLGIDIGGTFTDFVLLDEGRVRVLKLLTTVQDRSIAFMEGVTSLGVEQAGRIVHGSTV